MKCCIAVLYWNLIYTGITRAKKGLIPYLNREYSTDLYDDTTYPPLEDVPKKYAISRRNEWMVDQADVVVAYVTHGWGGDRKVRDGLYGQERCVAHHARLHKVIRITG